MKKLNKREIVKSGTVTAIGIAVGVYGSDTVNSINRYNKATEELNQICRDVSANGDIWEEVRDPQGKLIDVEDSNNEASRWYQEHCRGKRP